MSSLTKFIAVAFFFASKNCENNKNTDFATLFLVLQQRENKRKLADVNVNKRSSRTQLLVVIGELAVKNSSLKYKYLVFE